MLKAFPYVALGVLILFILASPISGSTTSAACGWSGTAPFCNGKCSSGQTQLPSNSQKCGTGACCWSGSKALCCNLPTCPTGFEWAQSQAGLDPCFLASQISEACAPAGQQEVLSSNGDSYAPPTAQLQTICTCSSPLYFLASACAVCQGGTSVDWKTWSAACTRVVTTLSGLTASASGIPDLPSWSLSNVTIQPYFNATIAQDGVKGILALPTTSTLITTMPTTTTFTTTVPPTTSSTPTTTTSTTYPLASNANETMSSASQSSTPIVPATPQTKSNAGAAVGGAIGGAALILLAVLLIWCMRDPDSWLKRPGASIRVASRVEKSQTFELGSRK